MLRISWYVLILWTWNSDAPWFGVEIVISGGLSVPQILTTVDARAMPTNVDARAMPTSVDPRAIPTSGIEKLCKTKSMV